MEAPCSATSDSPRPHAVDAATVAGGGAAVEPVEDRLAVVGRHAGAVVLDGDQHRVPPLAQLDAGGALAVLGRVVEQVGDHPGQPALVGPDHHTREVGVDVDRHVDVGREGDGLDDQLVDPHLLEIEVHHAGVEAGDLEQVFDQLLEALDVGDHEVERGPRPIGHVVALVLEHLDRGGERHEGRAQLMADVRRKPGVALDALFQRDRHLVEGVGQRREVAVVAGLDPRVEAAGGDGVGRVADAPQGAQDARAAHQPTAAPPSWRGGRRRAVTR